MASNFLALVEKNDAEQCKVKLVEMCWTWLRVVVTGCATQKLPTKVYWMRGDDFELTVGCRSNSRSWQLVCRNNAWHGSYGNCSTDG